MDEQSMGEIIDGDTLRFVRVVSQSPERVWKAISDEAELRAWMRYPVSFEQREGGKVQFFGGGGIDGIVFIFDPPRTLAFSFADANAPDAAEKVAFTSTLPTLFPPMAAEWTVRWDLEPNPAGCRITFTHRRLGGAHLWGLGDGWHAFIDQLLAYFDGTLDELLAERERYGGTAYTGGLTRYRAHASRQLLAWAEEEAGAGRAAVMSGERDAALAAIERLDLAARQLYEIARQDGPRPDYAPEAAPPPERESTSAN